VHKFYYLCRSFVTSAEVLLIMQKFCY